MRELQRNISVDAVRRDPFQRFGVGYARAFGILTRHYVLSEVIEAYSHPGAVAGARRLNGRAQFLAGNKPVGHAPGGAIGGDPAAKPGTFSQFEEQRAQHGICAGQAVTLPGNEERFQASGLASRNFSASIAAMQPEPAAVTACL